MTDGRVKAIVRYLARTLRLASRGAPFELALLLALGTAAALLPAATMWVSKLMFEAVAGAISSSAPNRDGVMSRLLELLILQAGISSAAGILSALLQSNRETLSAAVHHHAADAILQKAASLDVESFENPSIHDALRTAYADAGSRPLAVITQFVQIFQAAVALVSVVVLMAIANRASLPLVILAAIPGMVVSAHFGTSMWQMLRGRAAELRAQNYVAAVLTSETFVKEVRLFAAERHLLLVWRGFYQRFRAQHLLVARSRALWTGTAALTSATLIALATVPVLRRAVNQEITVGDFSLFLLGVGQVQAQLAMLLGAVTGIYEHLLYMRNVFDFLDRPARSLDTGLAWQGRIERIEFEGVCFRYPGAQADAIRDVSFSLSTGDLLVLVGENGSGKTTLIKLLTRLIDPTGGRILLNGMDATRFSPRSVQREMSVLLQDYGAYQFTARENIAFGDDDATVDREALRRAAEDAQIERVIERLPGGYDARLGRMFAGGHQLSGGEWQRVALARMFYKRVGVMVCDEPTSAQDSFIESELMQAFRRVIDRLTILVTHRLSLAREADAIVVLEKGRVMEHGTHEELMASRGLYARLFSTQAAAYGSDGQTRT